MRHRAAIGGWFTTIPELDRLEEKIPANLTLKAAFARLQQARAQYRIARADLFPSLTADPYATREKYSPNAPKELPGYPTTLNDFLLGADFSYEVDLWGRVRKPRNADHAAMSPPMTPAPTTWTCSMSAALLPPRAFRRSCKRNTPHQVA